MVIFWDLGAAAVNPTDKIRLKRLSMSTAKLPTCWREAQRETEMEPCENQIVWNKI